MADSQSEMDWDYLGAVATATFSSKVVMPMAAQSDWRQGLGHKLYNDNDCVKDGSSEDMLQYIRIRNVDISLLQISQWSTVSQVKNHKSQVKSLQLSIVEGLD